MSIFAILIGLLTPIAPAITQVAISACIDQPANVTSVGNEDNEKTKTNQ